MLNRSIQVGDEFVVHFAADVGSSGVFTLDIMRDGFYYFHFTDSMGGFHRGFLNPLSSSIFWIEILGKKSEIKDYPPLGAPVGREVGL